MSVKDKTRQDNISSRFFENQPNEICSHLSEKASKGSSYLEIKLFDEKGPLGDNVIKNLARNIYLISP